MQWWDWLISTREFKTPGAQVGWSETMMIVNLTANVLSSLVYFVLAFLLGLFRFRRHQPRIFQEKRTATWFIALFLTGAIAYGLRATGSLWPAMRLVIAANVVAALASWIIVALLAPLVFAREIDALHEERHDFANKVNISGLSLTLNLQKVERLQKTLTAQQKKNTELLEKISLLADRLKDPPG